MRNNGIALLLLGVVMILVAFTKETSVYNSPTFIGGEMIGGGSTHNLGLLQSQMMILHTGLAAFLAGVFLIASTPPVVAPVATREVAELTDEQREEHDAHNRRVAKITMITIGVLLALIWLANYLD